MTARRARPRPLRPQAPGLRVSVPGAGILQARRALAERRSPALALARARR